jgi:hypothetical protein
MKTKNALVDCTVTSDCEHPRTKARRQQAERQILRKTDPQNLRGRSREDRGQQVEPQILRTTEVGVGKAEDSSSRFQVPSSKLGQVMR